MPSEHSRAELPRYRTHLRQRRVNRRHGERTEEVRRERPPHYRRRAAEQGRRCCAEQRPRQGARRLPRLFRRRRHYRRPVRGEDDVSHRKAHCRHRDMQRRFLQRANGRGPSCSVGMHQGQLPLKGLFIRRQPQHAFPVVSELDMEQAVPHLVRQAPQSAFPRNTTQRGPLLRHVRTCLGGSHGRHTGGPVPLPREQPDEQYRDKRSRASRFLQILHRGKEEAAPDGQIRSDRKKLSELGGRIDALQPAHHEIAPIIRGTQIVPCQHGLS